MYNEAGEYFSKTRAKSYGKSANWPVTQKYLDQLKPGQFVLDVGCGDGRLLSGLPKGVHYVGIDFSETLLAIAREQYPDREFRLANIIENTGWSDLKDFDAVYCVATLHHVPTRGDQLRVLQEMYKTTKPGGMLYLTVWNLWQERMILKGFTHDRTVAGEVVQMDFDRHKGRYVVAMNLPYIVKLVEESGWSTEEVFYAGRDGERTNILSGQNLVLVAEK